MDTLMLTIIYLGTLFINITGDGVVLTNTDTIRGTLQINLQNDQLTIKGENGYQFLHADQINRVEVNTSSESKIFISCSFGEDTKIRFFEVLSDGKLQLVYREGIKMDCYDDKEFPPFFMKIGLSLYSISDKRQLLDAMDDRKEEVKLFIKENGLDVSSRESLIALFDSYNSMSD